MTPTDDQLTEAYFLARGWKRQLTGERFPKEMWVTPKGEYWIEEVTISERLSGDFIEKPLPKILDSYPDFKEHVLEVMEEEEFKLEIQDGEWFWLKYPCINNFPNLEVELIESNNILHAAVISATRYFKEKGK